MTKTRVEPLGQKVPSVFRIKNWEVFPKAEAPALQLSSATKQSNMRPSVRCDLNLVDSLQTWTMRLCIPKLFSLFCLSVLHKHGEKCLSLRASDVLAEVLEENSTTSEH